MTKILHVISSPLGEASYSIKLGNAIVEKIRATYPGSTLKETNLVKKQFPHLGEAQITSFYTPKENRTAENIEAIRHSDEAIRDLMDADTIVISTPFHNFGIPSNLKAWIDHIVRVGVTFNMDEKGFEGLVSGKMVYLALASGGIYSEGVMLPYDFASPYLTAILGFIGITDVTTFRVEGTAIPGLKDVALEKAIGSISV